MKDNLRRSTNVIPVVCLRVVMVLTAHMANSYLKRRDKFLTAKNHYLEPLGSNWLNNLPTNMQDSKSGELPLLWKESL
jgi:hypothetical protein